MVSVYGGLGKIDWYCNYYINGQQSVSAGGKIDSFFTSVKSTDTSTASWSAVSCQQIEV